MISHKQKGLMAALQPALATVLLLVVALTRPALTQGNGDKWLHYLTRPPFWRQQYTACGLSTIRNGVRPNLCANNVEFCFPDPYQPTFEVCTPCWKACLECTRYDTPLRNSSGITSHHCSSCGCATTAGCSSSRTCRAGSYCDKYYGRCISCYECLADGDVREGSCRAVCGHAARPQLPELFGLPFEGLAAEDSDWVIDAAIEVATWFKSSLGRIPAVGWLDLGQLLADRNMAFLPPGQLRYAVAQLTRANSSYSGYISPSPSPPPPSPRPSPSPPRPSPSPAPPNTTSFPPPGPRPSRARHLASYDPDPSSTINDPHSFTTTASASASARHLTQTYDPDPSINPSVAPIYPEDFVRVFVMRQLEPYDAFCPSDAAIFATGRSYPGCTCMSIPPEYQQDTNVVTGSTKQWVDYLTSVAGSNASSANAVCPEGFRCSAMNYQHLRHLFTRSQVHITMGICVPCLVGEYCPEGTVEKSQQLVEVCTRRSAFSESASGSGGSSNSSSSGGQGSSDCVNTRLCPAGSYCPEPSVRQNCTNGNFCTEGSTEPVTCDFDVIIATLPFSMVQPEPEYVLTSVTAGGSPLSGNYCPANSADPFDSCPRGYYCPEPGVKIVCPKGYFCPDQTVTPQRCGFLLECNKEGIGKPQVAWWGFLAFILLMLCLPVLGLVYNLYESRTMSRTARDDKLLEAMDAMGFGGDTADEGADGPGGPDDSGAGLYGTEEERPRGWWARMKKWFRRWVLCRGAEGGRDAGRSKRRTKSLDEEDQRSQTVGPLPPGFSDIDTYLTIQFENLSLRIKSGRRILHDVSGDFPHSHVHAIMGPSGSGKSSFITALIGKSNGGAISGNVAVWKSTKRDELAGGGGPQVNVQESLGTACTYDDVRYLTGFVPQDDVVHETMTVRENLTYSAALRLRRGTRRAEREEIVRGVLGMLGMAHVQHDVVGSVGRKGLSGGQRKRLNIGLELVAKPSLLMLDEPTSGLDAAVSYDVVHALKLMAEAGMNVMVVIHQPRYSIFEMFDSVLLLGVGGRTVFLGPVSLARKYFFFLGFRPPPGENRADFYLDVISGAVQRYDKRMTDEDFIPNELFQVWEEAGRGWLIEQLLNPMGYDNDDEEMEEEEEEHYYGVAAAAAGFNDEVIVPGEPDMYGNQGYMSEGLHGGHHHHHLHMQRVGTMLPPHDYAHPDPMGHHHHHHHPGHYHNHQSGYRSSPGEGGRTYHPDDYDAPNSPGRPGRHPYPEQYQSGDRFADTVKQAVASHRSMSSGSSAPNSPTGLSPLSPRRAGLVDGTAGSMTHQRSRFAPDRQVSSNLAPPLVIAHRAGSTPGSGSIAVLSPRAGAATAAALANATVSVTGMPPGGAAYDSAGGQGQHHLMDSTNDLATALAAPPVRARRRSNLGGRAGNGAAVPYGSGGSGGGSGGNANGTEHPAGRVSLEQGSRRVLNKVESLREGISGAPGGDVPASRRFLDKVESLKEAGIDTLPAAGSPLAREVMEDGRPAGPAFGAAGRTSANRRVPRTISAASVDLGAAASAHAAAAAAGSGSLGVASQGRGPAAPAALQVLPSEEGEEHVGGRGALSPAEGGEQHADGGGRARQHWNRLGANVRGALATAGPPTGGEIQATAADGENTAARGRHLWQRVNAALPTVLQQGAGTGTGTGTESADSPASAAVGAHNANRRASVGHAPGGGSKVTFGDVVAAATATAKRERLTGGPAGNAAARAALLAGPTFRRQTGTGTVALDPNAKLSMGEMLKLAREGKERQRQQQNPKAPAGAPAGRKPQAMTSRKALAVAVAAAGESTAGPGAERPPPPHQQGALPQGQGQGQGAMEGVDAKAELSKVKSGRLDIVKRTREAKDRDKEREGNAVQRDRDGGEGEENMKRPLLGEGPQFVSRGRRGSAQPRASYEGGAAHSGSTSQFHSGALPYDSNAVEAAYGGLLLQDAGMLEDDEQHVAEMNRAYLSKWSVPWRPKDLQAIQDNFDLLAGGKEDLTYGDFLAFFATTRRLLPERPYRHFVMEFSELFDLQPGMRPVDRSEFMGHVKEHLKDMSHMGHLRHRRHGHRHYTPERLEQILRAVKKYKRPKNRDTWGAGAGGDKDRKAEAEAHAEPQGEFAEPPSADGWWAGITAYFRQRNRDIVRRHRQLLAEREARRAGGHSHTHPHGHSHSHSHAHPHGHGHSHSHVDSPHVPQGTSRQALLYDTPQDSLVGDPTAAADHAQYAPPQAQAPPAPEQYAGASPFLSLAAYQPPAVESPRGGAGPRPNVPIGNRSIAQLMQQDAGRTGSGGSFSGGQRPALAGPDGVSGGGAPAIPVGLMSLGLAHQDQGRGRQRRASGLGLPAMRPGGMPGFPVSAGPGGLGEVEMSELSQPMVLNPARERELARMLGVAVGGMGPRGGSGEVSGVEGGGRAGSVTSGGRHGSVTRRGGRHLRPVLTPGGRASTDMFDLNVDHVASGRINKSRTGSRANSNASLGDIGAGGSGTAGGGGGMVRHGSVTGPQLSVTNRYGSVASNNSGRAGARIPAGRLGSIALGGGGRIPDSHAASIIAAANRVATITGGAHAGSFTGAARRMGSITAHDTRVSSIVAGGTRAPDVLVIGGGRVGSMTATGRMGSITAGGGARVRRHRQSYIAYGDEDPATDDGGESMRPSAFGGGAMTGKDMLQSAFARVREKNAEQSQGPAGTGRLRRQSYVLQPEHIEPHLVDVGSGAAAQSSHGPHPGMFQAGTSGPRGSAHISPDPSGIMPQPFPFDARTPPAGSYTQYQNNPMRFPDGSLAYPGPDEPCSPHSPNGSTPRPPGTSYPGGGYYPGPHADPYDQQPYGEQSYTQQYDDGTSRGQYAGTYEGASAGGAGGGWEGSSMAAKAHGGTMGGAKAGEGHYEQGEEDDGYRISIWVLLWYYVKDAATAVWSWVWYRLQDFVAGLLGNKRGGLALPSLGRQVVLVWRRSGVKFLNERIYALLDISMVIILGLILGAIQGHTSSLRKVPETSILVVLAFALTSLVTGLRTFGQEQLIFLTREAQAGLSVVSWMLGRIGWDLLLQALTPALYMGFYYAMTVFDTPFGLYYVVLFFVAWWGYGVGYLFSVLLEANNALLGGLCVTLIFGGIINGINPTVASADGNALMTGLQYLSYTRWAVEGVFIATATPTSSSMVFLTAGAMANLGFCDMNQHIKPIEGGLDPANLAEAFRPLFEQQFNTTVGGGGGGGGGGGASQNSQTVAFLYRVYRDPSIIDSMCRTAFALDLVWLFVWGVVTRLMTFAVLCYKVERRMTTASVFG